MYKYYRMSLGLLPDRHRQGNPVEWMETTTWEPIKIRAGTLDALHKSFMLYCFPKGCCPCSVAPLTIVTCTGLLVRMESPQEW